ncbi:hypothetical protein [Teredinibacter sp. KSP-S5-2]|uniref:hypothetical protein n=1 Tax=Teredinibacter sp. KSP-S5-2 TaxID=3034506 RepID=UPI0029343104|nr:hypothetical protein [Teredinibacter sp. KSP-S5-2]WNO08308.1 hypothetical protein P5V12_15155 [Teredinibacter sp. KSP-S5-2]
MFNKHVCIASFLALAFSENGFSIEEVQPEGLYSNVKVCSVAPTVGYLSDIDLDKDDIEKTVSRDEALLEIMIRDIDYRRKMYNQIRKNSLEKDKNLTLSESVKKYNGGKWDEIANCLSEEYKDGDKIFFFNKKSISPDVLAGFVVVRNGKVVVQVVLKNIYYD